ncbi:MAG: acyl-CoA thioesterase [Cyclobacteriaceae bacterium]
MKLQERTEVVVRFNETDPLGIVWHGHYVRYFEDGREGFGKRYGLGYLDCYKHEIAIPVVSLQCDYRKPLRYGDVVSVETSFLPKNAAKIEFGYRILREDGELIASGSSTQVFVHIRTFQLQLTNPEFYEVWKRKWGL